MTILIASAALNNTDDRRIYHSLHKINKQQFYSLICTLFFRYADTSCWQHNRDRKKHFNQYATLDATIVILYVLFDQGLGDHIMLLLVIVSLVIAYDLNGISKVF